MLCLRIGCLDSIQEQFIHASRVETYPDRSPLRIDGIPSTKCARHARRKEKVTKPPIWTARSKFVAVLVVVCGLTTTSPRTSSASVVVPMPLSYLAKHSAVIFAGTVNSISPGWNAQHTTIVTRIRFAGIEWVKGDSGQNSAVLSLRGGKVAGEEMGADGQPAFQLGQRYVLLLSSKELGSEHDGYYPIIGLYEGYFSIRSDTKTGRKVLVDSAGNEIVSVDGGKLVLVAEQATEDHAHSNRSAAKPSATDVPFTVNRVSPSRQDSLAQSSRTPPPTPRPSQKRHPKVGAVRQSGHVVTDWRPGSQRILLPEGAAAIIIDQASDPGTRLSEDQFLSKLRELSR